MQQCPEFTVHDALASPLVVTENMSQEEFVEAVGGMTLRAHVLSQFLQGNANWDDYLEACHQTGIEPIDFHNKIVDGLCFL